MSDYKWNDEDIFVHHTDNKSIIGTLSLKDLFISIEKVIKYKCICIETGIQHHFDPTNLDYYSTSNLLDYIIRKKEGMLYSFENESEHIKMFKESEWYKNNRNKNNTEITKYLKIIEGDSIEQLKIFVENLDNINNKVDSRIDLIFLDSKEFDEDHMLNEFKIIENKINDKCIVMCDDIHNPGSVKYKKAVPYIKNKVNFWYEYNTPTGLFVGIFGERN